MEFCCNASGGEFTFFWLDFLSILYDFLICDFPEKILNSTPPTILFN